MANNNARKYQKSFEFHSQFVVFKLNEMNLIRHVSSDKKKVTIEVLGNSKSLIHTEKKITTKCVACCEK